jgi:predicted RNA-binding Zn-ribbon protein involved in translation (DUF1610 family)
MIIKLPIPIYFNNEVFSNSIEIKKPTPGCIADTKKIADTGDWYGAVAYFISSCTEAIETKNDLITDKGNIKNAVRNMSYRTAEYVFTQIMLLRHNDDGVEGVYYCPRCGKQIICEAKKENGEIISDTRDFIKQLPVTFAEGLVNIFYTFNESVEIKTTDGKILETIENFLMRHPTLSDCMAANKKSDKNDDLRQQFQIYVESLVEINGQEIDNRFKNNFGVLMFDNCDLDIDIVEISKLVNQYGMDKRIERNCPECGKIWKSILNTSNFFGLEAPHM